MVPCAVVLREVIGERGAPAGDAGSHRSRWDAEYLTDLGVVEANEVTKRDGGAVIRRQPAQGGVDIELICDKIVDRRAGPAWFRDDVDG